MYTKTTKSINITVNPYYLEDLSEPDDQHYVWAYRVTIGEQPILNPGEKFEYTSGTPLSTPSGFMEGHYEMETKIGMKFDASIPLFSLDSPHISDKLN